MGGGIKSGGIRGVIKGGADIGDEEIDVANLGGTEIGVADDVAAIGCGNTIGESRS
jgi:hypothetical protein